MGMKLKISSLLIVLVLGSVYIYRKQGNVPPVPKLDENRWFGPGKPQKQDESIKPFKIDISKEVIDDLYRRLNITSPFQPSLEGVNQHYGMNSELLAIIIDYWKTKYNWPERQQFLNQYPHFKTKIQGLNIHFLHAKPKDVPPTVEVVPILLIHGWPGSVREFYEMIPTLTNIQKGQNFVFEVIVPSLPGYGFSDGASKPGMAPAQIAQIFNKLMKRLGFKKFYVQGGDWGSAISHDLAVMYPESVIGIHRNWCFTALLFDWRSYVGTVFPSLFFTEKETEIIFPFFENTFKHIMLESGYFHIQATKPDTVGVALRESPVGLAAYIIEKFTTWTNRDWKNLPDGGLTKRFTYDQLLDNVMIYWVTRSITTSQRLYAESYAQEYRNLNMDRHIIKVPAACNRFRNEIMYSPEYALKEMNTNLIHLTDFEDGGHFAAFDFPEVLGNDIIEFVQKVKVLDDKKKRTEL